MGKFFNPTISFGNLIELGVLIIAAISAFILLDARVEDAEGDIARLTGVTARNAEQIGTLIRTFDVQKTLSDADRRRLEREIEFLEERLSRANQQK